MSNLERRIAVLELATASTEELTFVVRYVAPGHLDAEIQGLCADRGKRWTRLPGETEDALIERASLAVKRNERGIASLSQARVHGPAFEGTELLNPGRG